MIASQEFYNELKEKNVTLDTQFRALSTSHSNPYQDNKQLEGRIMELEKEVADLKTELFISQHTVLEGARREQALLEENADLKAVFHGTAG